MSPITARDVQEARDRYETAWRVYEAAAHVAQAAFCNWRLPAADWVEAERVWGKAQLAWVDAQHAWLVVEHLWLMVPSETARAGLGMVEGEVTPWPMARAARWPKKGPQR